MQSKEILKPRHGAEQLLMKSQKTRKKTDSTLSSKMKVQTMIKSQEDGVQKLLLLIPIRQKTTGRLISRLEMNLMLLIKLKYGTLQQFLMSRSRQQETETLKMLKSDSESIVKMVRRLTLTEENLMVGLLSLMNGSLYTLLRLQSFINTQSQTTIRKSSLDMTTFIQMTRMIQTLNRMKTPFMLASDQNEVNQVF